MPKPTAQDGLVQRSLVCSESVGFHMRATLSAAVQGRCCLHNRLFLLGVSVVLPPEAQCHLQRTRAYSRAELVSRRRDSL